MKSGRVNPNVFPLFSVFPAQAKFSSSALKSRIAASALLSRKFELAHASFVWLQLRMAAGSNCQVRGCAASENGSVKASLFVTLWRISSSSDLQLQLLPLFFVPTVGRNKRPSAEPSSLFCFINLAAVYHNFGNAIEHVQP